MELVGLLLLLPMLRANLSLQENMLLIKSISPNNISMNVLRTVIAMVAIWNMLWKQPIKFPQKKNIPMTHSTQTQAFALLLEFKPGLLHIMNMMLLMMKLLIYFKQGLLELQLPLQLGQIILQEYLNASRQIQLTMLF